MVGEGKRLAGGLLGPYRQDMVGRCDRTEALMNALADMASKGEAEAPHARATAAQLQDTLKVSLNVTNNYLIKELLRFTPLVNGQVSEDHLALGRIMDDSVITIARF